MKKPLTPDEFADRVEQIINEHAWDKEATHSRLDTLIFDTLRALGYEEGIDLILSTSVWYA